MLHQGVPENEIVRPAKVISEYFREGVNDKLVLRQELSVALFGLVANRFNDFEVKFRFAGNKLPKPLAAQLQIVAPILAFHCLFSVATPVDASDRQGVFVLPIDLCRQLEIFPHFGHLAAVPPCWPGLHRHKIPDSSLIHFNVNSRCAGLSLCAKGFFRGKDCQPFQKAAEQSFLLRGKESVQNRLD